MHAAPRRLAARTRLQPQRRARLLGHLVRVRVGARARVRARVRVRVQG